MKKFSKREAIQFGWETMKANFPFFLGLLIAAFIIQAIPSWIAESIQKNSKFVAFLFNVVAAVVQIIVTLGMIRIALKFASGEKGQFEDLWQSYPLAIKYFLSSILYGLMVLGGTLLFIVPGIILAIRYQFYSYLIVDQNLGPIEALKKSAAITKNSAGNLFLFGLATFGVILLGVLCLLVGLVAAIPVAMVATAFVYRKLAGQVEVVVETT
ncbi:MAG: hypothetical protein HY582_02260 [Candidatus Omnitrophica bacterium]|nr:hypothetical protein [Candidatus Omnitrophota bacterium]